MEKKKGVHIERMSVKWPGAQLYCLNTSDNPHSKNLPSLNCGLAHRASERKKVTSLVGKCTFLR